MPSGTVRLHRVLRAPPERVYKAFVNADAIPKWYPPYGYTCKIHQMDVKVGGTFRMSFTNFGNGKEQSFGGKYVELIPNELIRFTDKFEDANLPGEMHTAVSLKKVSNGTDLTIVQEGIPEAIPVEECEIGWQECLEQLACLVESQSKE
jgi:uncharacterized protein YndB with AHSA1/START domain